MITCRVYKRMFLCDKLKYRYIHSYIRELSMYLTKVIRISSFKIITSQTQNDARKWRSILKEMNVLMCRSVMVHFYI